METTRATEGNGGRLRAIRSSINSRATQAQTSLRSRPAKWTGVAIGAGVGAGLLSRYLLHRRLHHRHVPDVIVIGGAC